MPQELKVNRDKERCVVCLECIRVCPQSQPGKAFPVIVESKTKGDPPEIANADNCIECLNCFKTCRSMAITFENYHMVEQLVVDRYLVKEAGKII
jgi:ferredoxin